MELEWRVLGAAGDTSGRLNCRRQVIGYATGGEPGTVEFVGAALGRGAPATGHG